MRAKRAGLKAAAGWASLLLMAACTNDNLLGNVTDKDSPQARLEAAQIALDNGDCQTAVDGFGELLLEFPGDLHLTMGLSAALVCRAGFEVNALVGVAGELAAGGAGVSNANVFKAVLDSAVTELNPVWQTDLNAAEALLAPYSADPDVAFNLGVIYMIETALIVANALDYLNGASQCPSCVIAPGDASAIFTALTAAVNNLNTAGLVTDTVTVTVQVILSDLDAVTSGSGVSCDDVNTYLIAQGIPIPGYVPGTC